jgi:hypothetical protein
VRKKTPWSANLRKLGTWRIVAWDDKKKIPKYEPSFQPLTIKNL